MARALLKRAPILLFDEATSALDPEDEAHVEAALAQLRESSTILVIAHKLDTIRSADRIVVIDRNGRVCQVGTHDDLIASGGVYADLWHARERAEGGRSWAANDQQTARAQACVHATSGD